jgi:hypothetical protein
MSTISITKLYELLSDKIGKEPAESLTSYIEEKISDEMEKKATGFATKEDLAHTKAEIIKWMFLFWIAQVGATFGFILLFLKK